MDQADGVQEILMFVPQPVYAVILLFPVSDKLDAEAKAGTNWHLYQLSPFFNVQTFCKA